MGLIKGVLVVLSAVCLFFALISMTFFWTLSMSLTYENVQEQSSMIVQDFMKDVNVSEIVYDKFPVIQTYCENNSEYIFSYETYVLEIPCDAVSQGESVVVEEGTKSLIKNLYYKNYDCEFIDCIQEFEVPFFLVSEQTQTYAEKKFHDSLWIFLILSAIILLFIDDKTDAPILVGAVTTLSSLPFLKITSLINFLSTKAVFFKFLEIFISESFSVSLKVLIFGIILLASGIVLKIFKVGFSISNFFSKMKEKSDIDNLKKKVKNIEEKNSKQDSKSKSK